MNYFLLCRSTNYGTTFKREDQQKFKLKGETKAKSINNVDFCLSNNRKVGCVDMMFITFLLQYCFPQDWCLTLSQLTQKKL